MVLFDEAIITAISGNGGQGCVSFRRERYVPKGGPDGGDGGDGGSIYIRATKRLLTLSALSSRRFFRARNGRPGSGKNQTGKDGEDVVIEVPLGTIVYDEDSDAVLADLTEDNQEIRLLRGGKGGKGNRHFATSTNRAPRMAQGGIPGQTKRFRLSLKFLADIGLIGLPNAGKSTLLSRLTMARPRIDSYPFTTLVPNLGAIVFDEGNSLTVADIPGLLEGASEGRGLGHRFLRHIERTKLLLHLLDITYIPQKEILEDFFALTRELERYNPSLIQKERLVLINKIDRHGAGLRDIHDIRKLIDGMGFESLPISALNGEGIRELKEILARKFFHG